MMDGLGRSRILLNSLHRLIGRYRTNSFHTQNHIEFTLQNIGIQVYMKDINFCLKEICMFHNKDGILEETLFRSLSDFHIHLHIGH